jgi:hypothetical protein
MNYKTVKKLKESGFQQWIMDTMIKRRGYFVIDNEIDERLIEVYLESDLKRLGLENLIYVPTLSELIEETTRNYYNFDLGTGVVVGEESFIWTAKTRGHSAQGYSPEEAVANLWMALNKN